MKRILIAGFGRMGSWLADALGRRNEVAISDPGIRRLVTATPFPVLREAADASAFNPDIFLNCAGLNITIDVFREFEPYLGKECILADIASVKKNLPDYYASSGRKFVSMHPMFGPTFANMSQTKGLTCIIIEESSSENSEFFSDLFLNMGIAVDRLTFSNHDKLMAEVLSVPFISTLLFACGSGPNLSGGTTWRRHAEIAAGLFSEDPEMLAAIISDTHTVKMIEKMKNELDFLRSLVEIDDQAGIAGFIKATGTAFLRERNNSIS